MLIIVDERRIERAASEDPGAYEIPESGTDDIDISKIIFEFLSQRRRPIPGCNTASLQSCLLVRTVLQRKLTSHWHA